MSCFITLYASLGHTQNNWCSKSDEVMFVLLGNAYLHKICLNMLFLTSFDLKRAGSCFSILKTT